MTLSDRDILASPELWVHRPRLPLVRRRGIGNDDDYGYLVEGCGLIVFLGNILLPATGRTCAYASAAALLADWGID